MTRPPLVLPAISNNKTVIFRATLCPPSLAVRSDLLLLSKLRGLQPSRSSITRLAPLYRGGREGGREGGRGGGREGGGEEEKNDE